MSSEWPSKTFAELIDDGALEIGDGYRAKNDELGGSGLIFLRAGHVKNTHIDFSGVDRFNASDRAKLCRKVARAGDVVVTTKGNSTGRVAFVTGAMPEFVYSPHLSYWRSMADAVVTQGFLRAWSVGREFSEQLSALSRSTDMAPYLSLSDQKRIRVTLPPIATQREVAELNDAINARLNFLRETNATLDAIAQALFKSWFVDFDPVHARQQGIAPTGMDEATAALFPDSFVSSEFGSFPRGWEAASLGDVFDINPLRKLKKGENARYLEMAGLATSGHCVDTPVLRNMQSGSKFRNGDTLLARITPCLENGKSAFVDFLEDGEVGWGSTEFLVLRPKPPLPEYVGYLLCRWPSFREYAIQSMAGTSGRQRVRTDVLARYPFTMPSLQVACAFGEVVEPLQAAIASNHSRTKTLASLRDTLLPRLISGQLRLPEAEAQLADAIA